VRRQTYGYLPTAEHRCPATGTDVYCVNDLFEVVTRQRIDREPNSWPPDSQALTIIALGNTDTINTGFKLTAVLTDHFIRPAGAFGSVCVYVCASTVRR